MSTVYVLTRTSGRPNLFAQNHASVMEQQEARLQPPRLQPPKPVHIVSYDDEETKAYLMPYIENGQITAMSVERIPRISTGHFPYNLYFNSMYRLPLLLANPGWMIILDDDDKFLSKDAVQRMAVFFDQSDSLLLWKVKFPDAIRPSNRFFGRAVREHGFPAIGFAFHTKWLPQVPLWDDRKGGDSRFVFKLSKLLPRTVWIDEILTTVNYNPNEQVHGKTGCGMGKRIDVSDDNKLE